MLYTARCAEFRYEEGLQKAKKTCEENGIEGLVVVGGDGSFRGAADLSARGILSIGVHGTKDNDISKTDCTIGYETALRTIPSGRATSSMQFSHYAQVSSSIAKQVLTEVQGRVDLIKLYLETYNKYEPKDQN